MIKEILRGNKVLFWLGTSHLLIFLLLLLYYPFNNQIVLGINSVIKPMKFALSIWLFSWTMSMIVYCINDQKKVKAYSWAIAFFMSFEQLAITSQALRGQLSHFNKENTYGIILFSLMGVFILIPTLWTAYIAYVFSKQKPQMLPGTIALSVQIGLVYFVIFSLFGGYISSLPGHTVGTADGSEGLWFVNWSAFFGDLRVAHFFGIHSLQIIPLFGISIEKITSPAHAQKHIWTFSILYLLYVVFVMIQGLMGIPFVS